MPTNNYAFGNGVDAVAGSGQNETTVFGGTWVAGDTWKLLVTSTAGPFTLGKGNLAGRDFVFGITHGNRVYIAAKDSFVYSALAKADKWEEQDVGAGAVSFRNQSHSAPQDECVALVRFQGRLAVIGGATIQIWATNADPAQFQLVQTLDNTGTIAPLSVQALGELDALYLDQGGLHSLRTRETTLNAFVDPIGLPVQLPIQALLKDFDGTQACAVVEPELKRYWCFIGDTIFVLSNFPSSKIVAWSTYKPTYVSAFSPVNPFRPKKFLVWKGRVYVRGTPLDMTQDPPVDAPVDCIWVYGDGGNSELSEYDKCVCRAELPWLDLKTPARYKQAQSINVVGTGQWNVSVGMDPKGGEMQGVYDAGNPLIPDEITDSTYDGGTVPYQGHGTHFKFIAETDADSATAAKLSALTLNYKLAENK